MPQHSLSFDSVSRFHSFANMRSTASRSPSPSCGFMVSPANLATQSSMYRPALSKSAVVASTPAFAAPSIPCFREMPFASRVSVLAIASSATARMNTGLRSSTARAITVSRSVAVGVRSSFSFLASPSSHLSIRFDSTATLPGALTAVLASSWTACTVTAPSLERNLVRASLRKSAPSPLASQSLVISQNIIPNSSSDLRSSVLAKASLVALCFAFLAFLASGPSLSSSFPFGWSGALGGCVLATICPTACVSRLLVVTAVCVAGFLPAELPLVSVGVSFPFCSVSLLALSSAL